jgi:hypothetical protein
MRKRTMALASAVLISMVSSSAAGGNGSDWMSGYTAYKALVSMESKGFMPTSIACRDSNKRGLDVGETEYKVQYAKNSSNIRYLWAVGSDYGPYNLKAKKEGYRQVSVDQYARKKSGLIVRCAIWHQR